MKAKSESEKKIYKLKAKSKSFIYITFLISFCHLFATALHRQLENFISSLIAQVLKKCLGKSEKWKVLSEKRKKNFLNKKRKAKVEKIIEKLKARSLILKTASEKQKWKFYDFAFQL